MFAFIGEQAGFGASHLSDSSRVSVAKQPNHLPFALGRICFRPWSSKGMIAFDVIDCLFAY